MTINKKTTQPNKTRKYNCTDGTCAEKGQD